MKEIIFYTYSTIFLALNFAIIYSDLKRKIIPNKYLLILVLLALGGLFFVPLNIYSLFYFFIGLLVSFLVYFFGFWAAGDAKYLLVLSLFLPYLSVHHLVGNLGLLILIFLILGFLYKLTFDFKNVFSSMVSKFKLSFEVYKLEKKGRLLPEIFKKISGFFAFFIALRLFRDNLVFFVSGEKIFGITLSGFNLLLFLFLIIGGTTFLFIMLKKYLERKTLNVITDHKIKFNPDLLFFLIMSGLFIYFIYIEYSLLGLEIFNKLALYLTLYLAIFLVFRLFFEILKHIFIEMEYKKVKISDLKPGDIINKKEIKDYIYKAPIEKGFMTKKERDKNFSFIDSVLDEDGIKAIRCIFSDINATYESIGAKDKIDNLNKLATFPFASYIFGAFIITYFLDDSIFEFIAILIRESLNRF